MTSVKFRLAQLYDTCECPRKPKHEFHYISFDKTFDRLREVTDDVLDYVSCKNDVLKFVFGQTYVKEKKDKAFDFKDRKSWSKEGIREKWRDLKEQGFNDIVVIGCVEEDLIREDACCFMRDPQKYAIALCERLIMHYAYQIPDEKLYNDQLAPLPEKAPFNKREGRLIYIAFKSKKERMKRERSRSSSSSSSSSSDSSSSDSSSNSSDSTKIKPRKHKH